MTEVQAGEGAWRVTHHASQCTLPCVRFLSLLSSIPAATDQTALSTDAESQALKSSLSAVGDSPAAKTKGEGGGGIMEPTTRVVRVEPV